MHQDLLPDIVMHAFNFCMKREHHEGGLRQHLCGKYPLFNICLPSHYCCISYTCLSKAVMRNKDFVVITQKVLLALNTHVSQIMRNEQYRCVAYFS